MLIKIICFVVIFGFSISDVEEALMLPMKKDSKYGDDVCSYTDKYKYVRHCKKGKYCASTIDNLETDTSRKKFFEESNIEICRDLPNITHIYTRSESCMNDFECEGNYKCINNVCSLDCPIEDYFFSSDGCKSDSKKITNGICKEIIKKKGELDEERYSPSEPNKICGKISSFAENPNDNMKGIYYANKYEYVYKGEVEDGEYVERADLCKSGFALYFYVDGKLEDPKDKDTVENNNMYLRCVTLESISKTDASNCLINYKINENGEILRYNVKKLNDLGITELNGYCSFSDDFIQKYIKLKFEKYREFYTKITEEERKTCGDLEKVNKYTCENNELIRTWYFYQAPEKYAAYNDRKKIGEVVDYLIQKKYPCYSLSQFLSIKIIYLLFLLLF